MKLIVLIALALLVLSACGDSSGEDAASGTDAGPETESAAADGDEASDEPGSSESVPGTDAEPAASDIDPSEVSPVITNALAAGSFCDVARALQEEDPTDELDPRDGVENFYNDVLFLWGGLAEIAPEEIRDDLGVIRLQFQDQRDIAATYDFDLTDLALGAEIDFMDTTDADAAQARIDSYLESECGLTNVFGDGELEDGPPEDFDIPEDLEERVEAGDPAAIMISIFGTNPEVADCLVAELDIEPGTGLSNIDPSRVAEPLCGTSFLEVTTGG